jgi:hypothetical protein
MLPAITPDWITAIASLIAAFGTVGAVVVALFRDQIYDLLQPTRVSLSIRDPAGEPTVSNKDRAYMFHFRLKNNSRHRTLSECRLLLTEVSRLTQEGKWRVTPLAVPIPFRWSPSELQPLDIDIGPGREAIADFGLFHVVEQYDVEFWPALATFPSSFPERLINGGTIRYRVELQARGLNLNICANFEVCSTGKWTEKFDELHEVISVRRIGMRSDFAL